MTNEQIKKIVAKFQLFVCDGIVEQESIEGYDLTCNCKYDPKIGMSLVLHVLPVGLSENNIGHGFGKALAGWLLDDSPMYMVDCRNSVRQLVQDIKDYILSNVMSETEERQVLKS